MREAPAAQSAAIDDRLDGPAVDEWSARWGRGGPGADNSGVAYRAGLEGDGQGIPKGRGRPRPTPTPPPPPPPPTASDADTSPALQLPKSKGKPIRTNKQKKNSVKTR